MNIFYISSVIIDLHFKLYLDHSFPSVIFHCSITFFYALQGALCGACNYLINPDLNVGNALLEQSVKISGKDVALVPFFIIVFMLKGYAYKSNNLVITDIQTKG